MPDFEEIIEAEEVITPQEARFDKWRNRAGFVLAPLAFLIIYFTPFESLKPEAHSLAAVISADHYSLDLRISADARHGSDRRGVMRDFSSRRCQNGFRAVCRSADVFVYRFIHPGAGNFSARSR